MSRSSKQSPSCRFPHPNPILFFLQPHTYPINSPCHTPRCDYRTSV